MPVPLLMFEFLGSNFILLGLTIISQTLDLKPRISLDLKLRLCICVLNYLIAAFISHDNKHCSMTQGKPILDHDPEPIINLFANHYGKYFNASLWKYFNKFSILKDCVKIKFLKSWISGKFITAYRTMSLYCKYQHRKLILQFFTNTFFSLKVCR